MDAFLTGTDKYTFE